MRSPCASAADRLAACANSSTLLPATSSKRASSSERWRAFPLDSKQPQIERVETEVLREQSNGGSLSSARLPRGAVGGSPRSDGLGSLRAEPTNATAGRKPQRSRTHTEILSSPSGTEVI